ncbi:unnamed protein product, partial [Nesidiocoris tenuis]
MFFFKWYFSRSFPISGHLAESFGRSYVSAFKNRSVHLLASDASGIQVARRLGKAVSREQSVRPPVVVIGYQPARHCGLQLGKSRQWLSKLNLFNYWMGPMIKRYRCCLDLIYDGLRGEASSKPSADLIFSLVLTMKLGRKEGYEEMSWPKINNNHLDIALTHQDNDIRSHESLPEQVSVCPCVRVSALKNQDGLSTCDGVCQSMCFLEWLFKFLSSCLEIGSNYQRKITALELYKIVLAYLTDENGGERKKCLRTVGEASRSPVAKRNWSSVSASPCWSDKAQRGFGSSRQLFEHAGQINGPISRCFASRQDFGPIFRKPMVEKCLERLVSLVERRTGHTSQALHLLAVLLKDRSLSQETARVIHRLAAASFACLSHSSWAVRFVKSKWKYCDRPEIENRNGASEKTFSYTHLLRITSRTSVCCEKCVKTFKKSNKLKKIKIGSGPQIAKNSKKEKSRQINGNVSLFGRDTLGCMMLDLVPSITGDPQQDCSVRSQLWEIGMALLGDENPIVRLEAGKFAGLIIESSHQLNPVICMRKLMDPSVLLKHFHV